MHLCVHPRQPAGSSTFPYKLSLQLLSAEFALLHVSRPRKLHSQCVCEREGKYSYLNSTDAR
jgi:hypothetical protein